MDVVEYYKIKTNLKKDDFVMIVLPRVTLHILAYSSPECVITCTRKQGDMMCRWCFVAFLFLHMNSVLVHTYLHLIILINIYIIPNWSTGT